jgi:bacteriocin biosynthesis cyclodehydratase domain-containing protein
MRPALKSGLLPVWRDRDTVQIGIDARRAVALSGMSRAAHLIGLLDGSRDRDQVLAAAADHGIPVPTAERVLTLLAAGGALDDFPVSALRELPVPLRAKLAAELATAALAYGDGDGGYRVIGRRRSARIRIEGERRIGRAIARILSASGVGQVRACRAAGAASGQVARTAAPLDGGGAPVIGPDLVILVGRPVPEALTRLVRDKVPHLAVSAAEAIGIVGPLVIPGKTACLRCLDYFRAASDPSWPLILAQLADRRPDPPACDAVLTAAVAAQAAAQVLTAIDKKPSSSAAANGTLELVRPGWQWRRRTWMPDPACPCAGHSTA